MDEDAVICDLAETYHIFDWKSLPLLTVATLVYGLGQNSRIKRKLSNEQYTTEEIMLMNIADALNILVWMNSEDGLNGTNKPQSFIELTHNKKENNQQGFTTKEEFEERLALLRGEHNG